MKTWVKNNWGFIAVILGFALWAHIALKADHEYLCSNESTAYAECS